MPKFVTIESNDGVITYELAEFGERALARIIDGFILIIPSLAIPYVAGWLYTSLLHASAEQSTMGQRAMNIKLIDAGNEKIGFGQATGRYFADILNVLTLTFGYLWMFWNEGNQCIHDRLTGTFVVKNIPVNIEKDITAHLLED